MGQRLIDANKLNFEKLYQYFETDNDYDYACCRVEDADTVFTIPDNPTNGDMIRALFSGVVLYTNGKKIGFRPKGQKWAIWFYIDWWDAPYNADREVRS